MYEEIKTDNIYFKDIQSSEEAATPNDEFTEETSEEATTTGECDIEYITTEGQIIDTRLYLSSPVVNASINDLYSISLSIRNILLVFGLLLILFKFKGMAHNAIHKTFYHLLSK